MNRLRSEAGQAAVLSVVFMAALLGAVALVLDVGSWFRAQRATQSAADAAALAGAQELPESTGLASALATQYLTANGGRLIGDLNPLLYRIAADAPLPAFRDVTLGGNAVADAGPGYDMATGLGTPDVDNLVRNLLILQRAAS